MGLNRKALGNALFVTHKFEERDEGYKGGRNNLYHDDFGEFKKAAGRRFYFLSFVRDLTLDSLGNLP